MKYHEIKPPVDVITGAPQPMLPGPALMGAQGATGGALDIWACPSRVTGWGGRVPRCGCVPKCSVCGHGPHEAVHGPRLHCPPGSAPWGHEFTKEA